MLCKGCVLENISTILTESYFPHTPLVISGDSFTVLIKHMSSITNNSRCAKINLKI
jgi:hypothetical protein